MSNLFTVENNCEMCNSTAIQKDDKYNYLCASCGSIGSFKNNDVRKADVLKLFDICHLGCLMIHSCISINHDTSHYKFIQTERGKEQLRAYQSFQELLDQLRTTTKATP